MGGKGGLITHGLVKQKKTESYGKKSNNICQPAVELCTEVNNLLLVWNSVALSLKSGEVIKWLYQHRGHLRDLNTKGNSRIDSYANCSALKYKCRKIFLSNICNYFDTSNKGNQFKYISKWFHVQLSQFKLVSNLVPVLGASGLHCGRTVSSLQQGRG